MLEQILKAARANPDKAVFISRRGIELHTQLALWIASRLEHRGYTVILQDAHFQHADFMLAMHGALSSGARVLALLSREYLESEHCLKEATSALDDQMNTSGRLILLKIDECQPGGLFRNVRHFEFLPVWRKGDVALMEKVILDLLERPPPTIAPRVAPTAANASQLIHTEVMRHNEDTFTGREADLARLRDLLFNGGTAALTRAGAKGLVDEAALAGMGGVGKTTLARAYAYRNRGDYHAVWWVRAEKTETLVDDLIDLGRRFINGLDRTDDREAAARDSLALISERPSEKPWLIVYDNAPGPGVVSPWRPAGNAHVIVTSRNPEWDAAVPLDVFTLDAAVDFLCDAAKRSQPKDREEAAVLAEQLGRLPLALAHAASKCRGARRISFADYGRRISEFWLDKPGQTSAHGGYGKSVFATFTLALDDIVTGGPGGDPAPCPEAEDVLGVLAHVAPEQIPLALMKPLFDSRHAIMSEVDFDRALEALSSAALITWGEFDDGAPQLNVHRLVQDVMRTRLSAAGRNAELAVLSTKVIETTYSSADTLQGMIGNVRWLPHAKALLRFAPTTGPESWYTLWTYLQIGMLEQLRGSLANALAAYKSGGEIAGRLVDDNPDNPALMRDLSVVQEKIGDVRVEEGNLPAALEAFQQSLSIAERLADLDPENASWQRDLAVSHNKIGDILTEQGNVPAALETYTTALDITERLIAQDESNQVWQRDLSISQGKIGDLLRAQGDLPAALEIFRASLAIRQSLADANPENAGLQRDLSVAHEKIGDVLRVQGKLEESLAEFSVSFDIAKRLAMSDPSNPRYQRDLSVSHDRLGDVLRIKGELEQAYQTFHSSMVIRRKLVESDVNNAGWQRDLSVSYNKVGEILADTGRSDEALDAFQKSLEIAARLAKADPHNAGWQRDLSVSQERVGNFHRSQGDLIAALEAFRSSLQIRERLAAADPQNAGWQRDLSYTFDTLAMILDDMGDPQSAIPYAEKSVAIDEWLAERDPTNLTWQKDVHVSRARLARLQAKV